MKVIFDTDNTLGLPFKEIDDGLALLYLLGQSDCNLLGITTTFGNGSIEDVNMATHQQLSQLNRNDIPLISGAGQRGEGNTAAADAAKNSAAADPGEITLLATGPLTNVLAAARFDPHFFNNLDHLVCMGGYLHPLHIGWRNLPDLNFSSDPEAACAVLNADTKVTIINDHICLEAPFTISDLQRTRFWPSSMRRNVKNWLTVFGLYAGVLEFYLWDLVPAVYLFDPLLFNTTTVFLDPSIANLEGGILTISKNEQGKPISMPKHIQDIGKFMRTVITAWERTATSQRLLLTHYIVPAKKLSVAIHLCDKPQFVTNQKRHWYYSLFV